MPSQVSMTEENWPTLHRWFMEVTGRLMGAPAKMKRAEAMMLASEEMGKFVEPQVSGAEFRRFDTGEMSKLSQAAARRTAIDKTGPVAPASSVRYGSHSRWVDDAVAAVLGQAPAPEEPSAIERADLLLKGMKRGQKRWEVCLDLQAAEEVQARLHNAAQKLGWKAGSISSAIIADEVHQALEKRVLVVVMRL